MHPGSGRRKGAATPKGRQVDPAALSEIQGLLADRSRQRDLLIEHLHLIQDRYGCLKAAHLAALAQEMRLALRRQGAHCQVGEAGPGRSL